jgi:oligopeptide transport system ATP-binding protein
MAHLLEVKDLVTRFYTDGATIHAVNGISYTLDEGESLAIVGESGSGKSVGVMSLMGLIRYPPGRVEGGEVIFRDRDLLKLSADEMRKVRGRQIAMVFQDPMTSLNPVLPVGVQLMEPLRAHMGLDKGRASARAAELLALVGLPNAADRLRDFPFQFSGGQRQRIMIAMALACDPSLLIADEPTTALDVTIQAQIVELVKELQQKLGMAIIWISHNLALVAGMVDKVIVMYSGYIVEQAPVDDLYERPLHPYTLGLLHAIPTVDQRSQERLASIEGMPPDLRKPATACPFAPRCPYVFEQCLRAVPPLQPVGPHHTSACWRAEELRKIHNFGEKL